eukprot:15453275-Alexandrium_andersonii.AAC.1
MGRARRRAVTSASEWPRVADALPCARWPASGLECPGAAVSSGSEPPPSPQAWAAAGVGGGSLRRLLAI